MARTNAISLLAGASTPATLAEIYGRVIENVQKSTLSTTLKKPAIHGEPRRRQRGVQALCEQRVQGLRHRTRGSQGR